MKIYVLDSGEDEKEFNKIIKGIKCVATKEQLMENGFTNYNPPTLYFCKSITSGDRYPVSFNISVSAKTLKITELMVMDEMFGQPHFVDKGYNKKIKAIIDDLIQKQLFVKGK